MIQHLIRSDTHCTITRHPHTTHSHHITNRKYWHWFSLGSPQNKNIQCDRRTRLDTICRRWHTCLHRLCMGDQSYYFLYQSHNQSLDSRSCKHYTISILCWHTPNHPSPPHTTAHSMTHRVDEKHSPLVTTQYTKLITHNIWSAQYSLWLIASSIINRCKIVCDWLTHPIIANPSCSLTWQCPPRPDTNP